MFIQFSKEAVAFIVSKKANSNHQLKFLHDSSGCGCADAGVPTFIFVTEVTQYDKLGESNAIPFYYQPEQAVYYESQLNVGFNQSYHCLTLSSDSQMYSKTVRLLPTE